MTKNSWQTQHNRRNTSFCSWFGGEQSLTAEKHSGIHGSRLCGRDRSHYDRPVSRGGRTRDQALRGPTPVTYFSQLGSPSFRLSSITPSLSTVTSQTGGECPKHESGGHISHSSHSNSTWQIRKLYSSWPQSSSKYVVSSLSKSYSRLPPCAQVKWLGYVNPGVVPGTE